MNPPPTQPELIAVGCGAVLLLLWLLWLSWNIGKLLVRATLSLLALASVGVAVWWLLNPH